MTNFYWIISNFDNLMPVKCDHPANFYMIKWRHCWRHVISNMFVYIIKVFILLWLATENDQQSYQRLTQTSERMRLPMVDILSILRQLGSLP